MKRYIFWLNLVLAFVLAFPKISLTVEFSEQLSAPLLEQRALALSQKIRCLACAQQSIEDSNSLFAENMRQFIRVRLLKGDTEERILSYLVQKYGEGILLKPRFSSKNFFLWALPFIFLTFSLSTVGLLFYRRNVLFKNPQKR